MAKKENNSKTFIFWGVIITVIIFALLIIFVPRANSTDGYYSIYNSSVYVAEKDSHSNNLKHYTDSFLDSSCISSSSSKNTFLCLVDIQSIVETSTNFNLNALSFCKTNKTLLKEQKSKFNTMNSYLENTQSYCDEIIFSFLNSSSATDSFSFNETLSAFVKNYYEPFVRSYADLYITTSSLIEQSAIHGMEVNSKTIAVNTDIMTKLKNILKADTLNSTEIVNLLSEASTKYAPSYYLSSWEDAE